MINMSQVYFGAGLIPTALIFMFFSALSVFVNLLFSDGIALLEGTPFFAVFTLPVEASRLKDANKWILNGS